jgi:hypothetical protein
MMSLVLDVGHSFCSETRHIIEGTVMLFLFFMQVVPLVFQFPYWSKHFHLQLGGLGCWFWTPLTPFI